MDGSPSIGTGWSFPVLGPAREASDPRRGAGIPLTANCRVSPSCSARTADSATRGGESSRRLDVGANGWRRTVDGTDSVFVHWTQVCGGGKCAGTSQEAPDAVHSTYTINADRPHGVAEPNVVPTMGGAKVVEHWVARVRGGRVSGHGWRVLADKPDSVVLRYRFSGTRQ